MEKPTVLYFCCKTLILLTCIATAAGLNTCNAWLVLLLHVGLHITQ